MSYEFFIIFKQGFVVQLLKIRQDRFDLAENAIVKTK